MTIFDCGMSKTGHFGGHFDPLGVKSTPWEGSILTPWGVILAMGYSFGLQGPIWTPRGVILTPSGTQIRPQIDPLGGQYRPSDPNFDPMVKIWHWYLTPSNWHGQNLALILDPSKLRWQKLALIFDPLPLLKWFPLPQLTPQGGQKWSKWGSEGVEMGVGGGRRGSKWGLGGGRRGSKWPKSTPRPPNRPPPKVPKWSFLDPF